MTVGNSSVLPPRAVGTILLCLSLAKSLVAEDVWQKATNEALAPIQDTAGLPRVLLIGDSISIYYTIPVRTLLKGKANVHRIPENGGNTRRGLEKLDAWLGNGRWDVIHFNWGLHDLVVKKDDQNAVALNEYETNMRELVRKLKATGARLLWASTTPVPEKLKLNAEGAPLRRNRDVVAYNTVARQIMDATHIPIDDLYSYALPRLSEIQRPENVHFKLEGSEILARQIGPAIARALEARPIDNSFQQFQRLLLGTDPVTWLFTGDSITEGARHTRGWRSYPEHFAERVREELERHRDVVINSAVGGGTLKQALRDFDWQIGRFKPQVVFLMFGMNDCTGGAAHSDEFRLNLERMVQEIRKSRALPVLQTPNSIYPPNSERRKALSVYVDVIRRVAVEGQVPLIDHYDHWSRSKTEKDLLYWLSDASIHPNHFGHIELAKRIFQELGIFNPERATCKLFVP